MRYMDFMAVCMNKALKVRRDVMPTALRLILA